MTELEQAALAYLAAHEARVQSDISAERDESVYEAETLALARLREVARWANGNEWDEV